MSRQKITSHIISQVVCLLFMLALMLLIRHLPTKIVQVNNQGQGCESYSDEAQFVNLPKQEELAVITRRIRKVSISIETYLLEGTAPIKGQLIRWQNAIHQYKSYANKALLMDYIHDLDGKKHYLFN